MQTEKCPDCGAAVFHIKSATSGWPMMLDCKYGHQVAVQDGKGHVVTGDNAQRFHDSPRHDFHAFKCPEPAKILA